ncbi:hypothetical protein CA54_41180 [Symmachiella macrocystis]|uniref:Uncharacterized protein n=1 Tax=Symmachiella macrocystis TaxID=2527985 RepID=A0A5C6BC62_9PLAN|nr:hypothetical protein CA54_41180 [Symmachiella macrocystis]
MTKSNCLTGAILEGGSFSDDFADVLTDPIDDRIVEGLKSGYTGALFNACVAVKNCTDSAGIMSLLISVNRNLMQVDEWQVVEETEVDLETSLQLIQMELLESACFFGVEATPMLTRALACSGDALHFAVLNGIQSCRESAFVPMLQQYRDELRQRAINEDSKPELFDAVNKAIAACEASQLV